MATGKERDVTGSAATPDTDLLMVHADEHEPVLVAPVASGEADTGHEPGAGYEDPEHLWDESREANDLRAQGWGVIAPEGPRGDELLGRISALVIHRGREQGDRPVRTYRVPPRQSAAEAARWRKLVYEASEPNRKNLPRYLLLLGDLDEVSPELQIVLGSEGYVGRLAFDRPEDYEAYVEKLLRWEAAEPPVARARAVFHTVRDRTPATTAGHRSLMVPGMALARTYQDEGDFPTAALIELDHGYSPKPGPLIEEATKAEPGLLFTISHGAGAPRRGWGSSEQQRLFQGGMSFGRAGGLLTGEALAGRPFMPGGVWFMLACFGAGTPATSKYEPWLRNLAAGGHFNGSLESVPASLAADGRPFVASVPKAVLASPEGPLAFIGHVDLAWTYSFRELDGERPVDRPNRFIDVFNGLLRRDRVGVAFRELLRHYGQANTELTALVESGVDDPQRRGHLWMLRNDLAGYVLLGDPAARLPIEEPAASTSLADPYAALGLGGPPPPRTAGSVASPLTQQQPRSQAQAQSQAQQRPPTSDSGTAQLAPDVDPEALERAIGLMLVGELGTRSILSECELNLGRREFEQLVERYLAAGRRALGLPQD